MAQKCDVVMQGFGPCPDRSAVEVQYILRIHFSDSAGYTTSTLQLDGSIIAVCSYTAFALRSGCSSFDMTLGPEPARSVVDVQCREVGTVQSTLP